LIQPRDAGLIDESHVLAEFHERERIAGIRREAPDAVTLFKSVGHVALDLAALEVARGPLAAAAR
jgi:ornithine cyclodeaminase/alanine dehydrogenase-like protein (mu-crystallin family)